MVREKNAQSAANNYPTMLRTTQLLQALQEAHRATNNNPTVLRTSQLQQAQQKAHGAAEISSWKETAKMLGKGKKEVKKQDDRCQAQSK